MATQYTVGSTFVPIAEKQGIVYNGSPVDVEIASAKNATEGQGIVLRSGASQSFAGKILARSKDVDDAATLNVVDFGIMTVQGGGGGNDMSAELFRQAGEQYDVGDTVYLAGLGARYQLACIEAGTTDGGDIDPAGLAAGQYVTDGTARWIVEDTTQGDSVGDITLHPTLLPGHILADGATVTASDYPRLLKWVQNNAMTGTDVAHYQYDATADTLIVPNASGRVLQSGAAVAEVAAGLPNLKSQGETFIGIRNKIRTNTGDLFIFNAYNNSQTFSTANSSNVDRGGFKFDASNFNPIYGASTTVQPPAITLLAQIKY